MNCGNNDPQRTKNADALLPDFLQGGEPAVCPTVSPDVSPTPSVVNLDRQQYPPKAYIEEVCMTLPA
jgi:hypothetical protein